MCIRDRAINRLLERVNLLVTQQMCFIADAAHELRSPLTALSVQAQNLDRATSLADMQARVAPLQAGIERAQRLTDQLLNLARIQTGGTCLLYTSVLAFWISYILTRPLGASSGDFLTQPISNGGLGLGAVATTGIFLTIILGLVIFLTVTRRDVVE